MGHDCIMTILTGLFLIVAIAALWLPTEGDRNTNPWDWL